MIKPPCLNCEKRNPHCHSDCEGYINYKKEKTIENERINKVKKEQSNWYSYKENKYKRIKNYRG